MFVVECNHGAPQCDCDRFEFDDFDEAADKASELMQQDITDIMDVDPDVSYEGASELASTYTILTDTSLRS